MYGRVYALGKIIDDGGKTVGLKLAAVDQHMVLSQSKEKIIRRFGLDELVSPQIEIMVDKVKLKASGQLGSKPAVVVLNELEHYGYKVMGVDGRVQTVKNEDVESFFGDRHIINGELQGNRVNSIYDDFELITDVALDWKITSQKAKSKMVGAKVSNLRVVGAEVVLGYENYSSQTDAVVPDIVNVIGKDAMRGMYHVNAVKLPSSLRKIDDRAFMGSDVSELEIPESVKILGESAFEVCEDLQYVEFKGVVEEITKRAFHNCPMLLTVKMKKGVKSFGEESFSMSRVHNMEIPHSVERIEDMAFLGCLDLGKLVIPRSVRFIGANVFESAAIEVLYLPRELPYDSTYLGVEEKKIVRY